MIVNVISCHIYLEETAVVVEIKSTMVTSMKETPGIKESQNTIYVFVCIYAQICSVKLGRNNKLTSLKEVLQKACVLSLMLLFDPLLSHSIFLVFYIKPLVCFYIFSQTLCFRILRLSTSVIFVDIHKPQPASCRSVNLQCGWEQIQANRKTVNSFNLHYYPKSFVLVGFVVCSEYFDTGGTKKK